MTPEIRSVLDLADAEDAVGCLFWDTPDGTEVRLHAFGTMTPRQPVPDAIASPVRDFAVDAIAAQMLAHAEDGASPQADYTAFAVAPEKGSRFRGMWVRKSERKPAYILMRRLPVRVANAEEALAG